MYTKDILIMEYGHDILSSDLFREGYTQQHHKVSTVANHSLNVAAEALAYCMRKQFDDVAFLRKVVVACLYHDLGIIDRTKYSTKLRCWREHPLDSVSIYVGAESVVEEDVAYAIANHMRFKSIFSKNKILRIVWYADKKASIKERLQKNYGKSMICSDFFENVA